MGLRQIFPHCENPVCPYGHNAWAHAFRKDEGIRFRGRRHCSPECLEQGFAEELLRERLPSGRSQRKNHRVPLGLLLLSSGIIENTNLQAALVAQREAGKGRIGEWLRQLAGVTERQITAALGMQWSCPIFPLENHRAFLDCAHLIPLPILEPSRMVTAHYLPDARLLYMAFADWVDYGALYAIEKMLGCRTEPCLAVESALEQALGEIRDLPHPPEMLFDGIRDPKEIARTVRKHAAKLKATEVRYVICGGYLWIRLIAPDQESNLLFHIAENAGESETALSKAGGEGSIIL